MKKIVKLSLMFAGVLSLQHEAYSAQRRPDQKKAKFQQLRMEASRILRQPFIINETTTQDSLNAEIKRRRSRMQEIINELRRLYPQRSGKYPPGTTASGTIQQQLNTIFRQRAEQAQLQLKAKIKEASPPPDSDLQRALEESKKDADDEDKGDDDRILDILTVGHFKAVTTFSCDNEGQLTELDEYPMQDKRLPCSIDYHPSGNFLAIGNRGKKLSKYFKGDITVVECDDRGKLTEKNHYPTGEREVRAVRYNQNGTALGVGLLGFLPNIRCYPAHDNGDLTPVSGGRMRSGAITSIDHTPNGIVAVSLTTDPHTKVKVAELIAAPYDGANLLSGGRYTETGDSTLFSMRCHPTIPLIALYCMRGMDEEAYVRLLLTDNNGQLTKLPSFFTQGKAGASQGFPYFPNNNLDYDPSGQFLAAANKNSITTFRQEPKKLTRIHQIATGGGANLAFNTLGTILALANRQRTSISTFKHDQGYLTPLTTIDTASKPLSLTFRPMSESKKQQYLESLIEDETERESS